MKNGALLFTLLIFLDYFSQAHVGTFLMKNYSADLSKLKSQTEAKTKRERETDRQTETGKYRERKIQRKKL